MRNDLKKAANNRNIVKILSLKVGDTFTIKESTRRKVNEVNINEEMVRSFPNS